MSNNLKYPYGSSTTMASSISGAEDTRAMLAALRQRFLPGKVVVLRPADTRAAAEIIRMAPYTEFMVPKTGRATAYVCTDFVCKLPTTDISQMLANLQATRQKID